MDGKVQQIKILLKPLGKTKEDRAAILSEAIEFSKTVAILRPQKNMHTIPSYFILNSAIFA